MLEILLLTCLLLITEARSHLQRSVLSQSHLRSLLSRLTAPCFQPLVYSSKSSSLDACDGEASQREG